MAEQAAKIVWAEISDDEETTVQNEAPVVVHPPP